MNPQTFVRDHKRRSLFLRFLRGLALFCLSTASSLLPAVEPLPQLPTTGAIPKSDYWNILERRWKMIEPVVFTAEGSRYLGEQVSVTGIPTSLKSPIVLRLPSGMIVRLMKVQKTDREELATFRKPPSKVIADGPILAIDAKTRTVTIHAFSTSFVP